MKDKRLVVALSVVLCVILVALLVCERQAPEAGSELLRSLMGGARG